MRIILIGLIGMAMQACGVKGDPIPPKTPAEMGRGKPNFERAAEELDFSEEDTRYKKRKRKDER